MESAKERLSWVDTLKAIGIIAIIVGHIDTPFSSFLFSWHVPLFFVLSGFFVRSVSREDLFPLKEIKRLGIPYLIAAMAAIGIETMKRLALGRDALNYGHEILGVLFFMDMHHLINTYAFVLWFLPSLLVAKWLAGILLSLFPQPFVPLVLATGLFFLGSYEGLPFGLSAAFQVVVWILYGNLLWRNQTSRWLTLAPVLLVIIWIFSGVPSTDVGGNSYSDKWHCLGFAAAFVGTLVLIMRRIPFSRQWGRVSSWIGSSTMALMIVHPYTNNIADWLLRAIGVPYWFLKIILALVAANLAVALWAVVRDLVSKNSRHKAQSHE